MVLVRAFTATPTGWMPTGIVAVTLMQLVTARPSVGVEDATDVAAVLVAAGASTAIATLATIAPHLIDLMTFPPRPTRHAASPGWAPVFPTPACLTCQEAKAILV